MLQVTLSQLRTQPRRFAAVFLAVAIAVAFVCAAFLMGDSSRATLKATIGESYAKADLVAVSGERPMRVIEPAAMEAARDVDGVEQVYVPSMSGGTATVGNDSVRALFVSNPPERLDSATYLSGNAPSGTGQTAVDEATAQRFNLHIGDNLKIEPMPSYSFEEDGGEPTVTAIDPFDATVTGITAKSDRPELAGQSIVTLSPDLFAKANPGSSMPSSELIIALAPDADSSAVSAQLTTVLADAGVQNPLVRTADAQVEAEVSEWTGGQMILTTVLLSFAAIAVLVSVLVVGNTYSVLIAQRTRDLALLRCVGATRSQVRRSVLSEGAVIGALASVVGVGIAIAGMYGVAAWVRSLPDAVPVAVGVSPTAIILPLFVGVALTLVATLRPAAAATRVEPIAALRPSAEDSGKRVGSRVRLISGLIVFAIGTLIMLGGAATSQVLVALPGGMMSFVGVLLLVPFFLPKLAAVVGRVLGGRSVPGRLAALNSVRNPRRTSTTATALLIGVVLVAMMMTGAQTARQTLNETLADAYPVDISVSAQDDAQAKRMAQSLLGTEWISETTVLEPTALSVEGGSMYVADPQQLGQVVGGDAFDLRDGMALVPKSESEVTSVTVIASDGTTKELPAQETGTSGSPVLITEKTLESFGAAGKPAEDTALYASPIVWASLSSAGESADLMQLQDDLSAAAGTDPSQIGGGAPERLAFNMVIDTLLWVVTGLLGVAVLIALIGVANTLSLSVLERTRENALLRALGLTRGQLRWMLMLEGLLLAGVAAVVGVVLGVFYGWAGSQAILGIMGPVALSVPWLQLGGVLLIALLAGLLASVLPARRATRLSPVRGLATV